MSGEQKFTSKGELYKILFFVYYCEIYLFLLKKKYLFPKLNQWFLKYNWFTKFEISK